MSYMERARTLYDRGEIVRAAFTLAEGIKRNPTHEDALHWFLQLYVEELDTPGLEQDLVHVIETQQDNATLLALVMDELEANGQSERLSYLNRVRRLRRRTPDSETQQNQRSRSKRRRITLEPQGLEFGTSSYETDTRGDDPEANSIDPALLIDQRNRTPRRRRRTRPSTISEQQGILPLELPDRPIPQRNDWSSFSGLAGNSTATPIVPPQPQSKRRPKKVANTGSSAATPTSNSKHTPHDCPSVFHYDTSTNDQQNCARNATMPEDLSGLTQPETPSVGLAVPKPTETSAEMVPRSTQADSADGSATTERCHSPVSSLSSLAPDDALNPPSSVRSPSIVDAGLPERLTSQAGLIDSTPSLLQPRAANTSAQYHQTASQLSTTAALPTYEEESIQIREISNSELACGRLDSGRYDLAEPTDFGGDFSSNNQLLQIAEDDVWSLGALIDTEDELGKPQAPVATRKRRFKRTRPNRLASAAPIIASGMWRNVKGLAKGRNGLYLLLLVAVLGTSGASYRACAGIVANQLAAADRALQLADGQSLQRAVDLYDEYLPSEHSPQRERLDFARALLALEFGIDSASPTYHWEDCLSVYGMAALTLHHLANGNLTLARPEGQEIAQRHPDHWIAHWTQGRILAIQGTWERARESYQRAHELDAEATLPLIGLTHLAINAAEESRAGELLNRLESLHPAHPLIPVARTAVAFGLDPTRSNVGALDVPLPDPNETLLSQETTELLLFIRARQALAEWRMEDVTRLTRQLRSMAGPNRSLHTHLLEALVATRDYRLDDVLVALQRADQAVPAGSPAQQTIQMLAVAILRDLGRPDLALAHYSDRQLCELTRAELLIEAGHETEALRLLGRLMEQTANRYDALRLLVDFHLRRGAPDRAQLRATGLDNLADQAYGRARIAQHEANWEIAREQAQLALQTAPLDLESLFIWAVSTAHLGLAENAIERLDDRAARSLLLGAFDRTRLDVLLASGGAPRETIAQFASLLQATQPTSVRTRTSLALAYEAIGDIENARETARAVVEREPNNHHMTALLTRLEQRTGDESASLEPRNDFGPTTLPGPSRRPPGR